MTRGPFIVRAFQGNTWVERSFSTRTAADFYFAGVRQRGHIDPDLPSLSKLELRHQSRGGAPVLLRELQRASGGAA